MKEFKDLQSFHAHLKKVISNYKEYEIKSSNFLGAVLGDSAKKSIGHLQDGAGEFPSWQPLAESTKLDKEKLGYKFNEEYNPLYRTGELRDSISYVFNFINHILY